MPTYQYECQKCAHRFEAFQAITAPPLETCPECRGAIVRLISGGAGFLFKGSGFYITDYRSDDYKKRAKADKEASSKTGAGTPAKSESGSTKPDSVSDARSAAS